MGGFGDMFGTIGGFTTGEPGGFMNVLGPGGMGLTGSTSAGTAQVLLDPTTQALNSLRLSNMLNMGGAVGGFEGLVPNYMNSLNLSGTTGGLVDQAINLSQQPGLQAGDWYNQAMSTINPTGEENRLTGVASGMQNTEANALWQNIAGLQNLAPQLLGAGNDYFRQILQPNIQNQSSLMGLGRSGANEEAQAKGAASISLPIAQLMAQLTQQAYGQYGTGLQNILGQNYQAQSGLGQQYLQGVQGINQAFPGVASNLQGTQLQRLLQGVQASDIQRQTQSQGLQSLYQGLISGMNQTPYTPAPTQKTTGTGDTGILTSVLGGGGGSGIGAAAGKALLA